MTDGAWLVWTGFCEAKDLFAVEVMALDSTEEPAGMPSSDVSDIAEFEKKSSNIETVSPDVNDVDCMMSEWVVSDDEGG